LETGEKGMCWRLNEIRVSVSLEKRQDLEIKEEEKEVT